jgi:hypothetical protein
MENHTAIATADGELHAQQIRAFLEAHGITCAFRGEALRLTHGFTVDGLGQVEILVPADQAERARSLLAAADAGDLWLGDDADVEA